MKTPDELEWLAIDGKIQEKAQDDLGIYCQGVYKPDGSYEARTPWQDGWNAAVMKHTQNVIVFHKFIDSMSREYKVAFSSLLLEDVIELANSEDSVHLWLNVNDIFYTAADSEEVSVEDLPVLADLQDRFGFDGILAWVAKKRNMEPLIFKYKKTDKYIAAETELNNGIVKSKSFIQKVLSICGL